VRVRLNGGEVELEAGATLAGALARLGVTQGERGVAAAVDGDVVPRAEWERTPLRDGAAIEVVRAAAGG
jgi:sulfur carrier protein